MTNLFRKPDTHTVSKQEARQQARPNRAPLQTDEDIRMEGLRRRLMARERKGFQSTILSDTLG